LAKGKISQLVIQALKEIGNGKVREDEEKKIIDLLMEITVKVYQHFSSKVYHFQGSVVAM
jgi:hypothetical protein